MSYRICCVTFIAYDQVVRDMEALAIASDLDFAATEKLYSERSFIYSDSLTHGMHAIGAESKNIHYNLETLQKRWAAENNFNYREEYWQQDIAIAQIKSYRPDVVLIHGLHRDPKFTLVPTEEFRAECPYVKLVLAISGFPMEPEVARYVDIVLANGSSLYDHYRSAGCVTYLHYHAFDDRIPHQLADYRKTHLPDGAVHDFTFLGSTGCGWGSGHKSRYYDLVYLLAGTPLEIWGFERILHPSLSAPKPLAWVSASLCTLMHKIPPGEFSKRFEGLTVQFLGTADPSIPLTTMFPGRCKDSLFGMPMYDVLERSRVSFNRHSDVGNEVGNLRLFHATGLRSCLLTDTAPNMKDLFEADTEIVTYSSIEEAAEKAQYLLDHEAERQAIAEAGYRRTLRDHTFIQRCRHIDEIVRERL